jgi:hypothetical protein
MKPTILIAAIALLIFSTNAATAQNNRSLRDESMRIRQGVISGQLTAAEAHRLNEQKRALKAEAFRYKLNDGHINPLERADLRRDNRRLNRNIFRQKHDRQKRF